MGSRKIFFSGPRKNKAANKFNTSMTSTAIRIIESDFFPAIHVFTNELKRKWFFRASQLPERWFPEDCPESNSIAYKMMKNKSNSINDQFSVPVDTWFDYQVDEKYKIIEQSIRVTTDAVLTIITFSDEVMLEEQKY